MNDSVVNLGHPRVLIVDDDMVIRLSVSDFLDEAGYTILEAGCGRDGLDAFHSEAVDLVILDVMMPDMDGFEVCQQIRSTPKGRHLPILMATGNDDVESVTRAFEVGATDFTSKPFNYELLVHRVQYMLRAKLTADTLRDREKSLAYAQEIAQLGNWELDLGNDKFTCSSGLGTLLGADASVLTYADLLRHIHPDDITAFEKVVQNSSQTATSEQLEFRIKNSADLELWMYLSIAAESDSSGKVQRLLGTIQDITERRMTEDRIRELAYYDTVTGLPNRLMFSEYLQSTIAAAQRHKRIFAVLFIDLDRFKNINDTWGHTIGDTLLQQISRRLSDCLRNVDIVARHTPGDHELSMPGHTVARLGGDEFVVLLSDLAHPEDAAVVAQRINQTVSMPITIEEMEIFPSASIGISVYPTDGDNEADLLKRADRAMYSVKDEGRNGYQFYTANLQTLAHHKLRMEADLRKALENQEFFLHYQPKLSGENCSVLGVEALIRWQHPETGMINPDEFIPIAEETGLIVPIGEWVLNEACAQLAKWEEDGHSGLEMSVNLSAVQMRNTTFIDTVKNTISRHGLNPGKIELELTESLLMDDIHGHMKLLSQLKEFGVKLSIDDFGTGYSSLSYLKRMSIDKLKVDRSFVQEIAPDNSDAALLKGIIGLAHSLQLDIVAEGIETQQQLDLLQQFGSDELQGYFFSKPLPADECSPWINQQNSVTSDLKVLTS